MSPTDASSWHTSLKLRLVNFQSDSVLVCYLIVKVHIYRGDITDVSAIPNTAIRIAQRDLWLSHLYVSPADASSWHTSLKLRLVNLQSDSVLECYFIVKVHNYRGDITDVSAKTNNAIRIAQRDLWLSHLRVTS